MSIALKQFRLYFRVTVILAVALAVGLLLFNNRDHKVVFWFFGLTDSKTPTNVVVLIAYTALLTLASWWTLSLARGLWRDLRAVERARDASQAGKILEQRAAELDERERRVDDKVHDAIIAEDGAGEDLQTGSQ
jgi:hypothetical protein